MTSDHSPIRVLYVINGLGTGGAERSLAELIDPLRNRGVEIRVDTLERRSAGVHDTVAAATTVNYVGPGLAKACREIRRDVRRSATDIIHTTLFEADLVGRIAGIGTGIPVVSSVVNTSYEALDRPHPDVSPAKLRIGQALDGFTARHLVTRVHTLTEASADATTSSLGIRREVIDVIPRGRDRNRLGRWTPQRRQSVRASLGIEESRLMLLSVGRQEHQKGQVDLVAALPQVIQQHPGVLLVIAGREGAASSRLMSAIAENGVDAHVRVLGHRDDVPDLMVAADVLAFPSLYEGFGGTLIEAMALELPVIASDIPTLREVVGDAAILTPAGSPPRLAEAIVTLLDDEETRSRLKVAGPDRFEARYTIGVVADQMAEFYRAIGNETADP